MQHVLEIDDDRFRKHRTFQLYAFNVMMRRKVSMRASLKVKHKKIDSKTDAIVKNLDVDELKNLAQMLEKNPHGKVADKNVQLLLNMLVTTGSAVPGTPYAKKTQRQEILSLIAYLGVPTFFVTLNPFELDSPIVNHLTGETEKLDPELCNTMRDRALLAASDPKSCSDFFDIYINTILEVFFGVRKGLAGKVDSTKSLVGFTNAYYGTVETQGRGTLHFHCLVWVSGMPSPDEMKVKLKDEAFKKDFIDYLESLICNDIREIMPPPSRDEVSKICTSLPTPSCNQQSFASTFEKEVAVLAKRRQVHKCTFTCFKKQGSKTCHENLNIKLYD